MHHTLYSGRLLDRAEALRAQIDGPAGEVPSPCTGVCRMTADRRWCQGCFRTIDEIRDWSIVDEDGRRATWQRAIARARAMAAR